MAVLGSGPERNVMLLITNKCPFCSRSDIPLVLSNAHAVLLMSDRKDKTNAAAEVRHIQICYCDVWIYSFEDKHR